MGARHRYGSITLLQGRGQGYPHGTQLLLGKRKPPYEATPCSENTRPRASLSPHAQRSRRSTAPCAGGNASSESWLHQTGGTIFLPITPQQELALGLSPALSTEPHQFLLGAGSVSAALLPLGLILQGCPAGASPGTGGSTGAGHGDRGPGAPISVLLQCERGTAIPWRAGPWVLAHCSTATSLLKPQWP